ncbi:phosphatase PAP2 family protein [Aurantibacillus circumpalustris]|uniref:phosphatase PAP2 family protein n=1 Tax=Aurantibacillus circumpalustris TaxID=3036359 RepID=UPI00295C18CD|nr:phosphatase PAP2 family protein [Aurantibacillus circumpalustris]
MKKIITISVFLFFGSACAQNLDFKILRSLNQKEMPIWDKTMEGFSFSVNPLIPVTVVGIWANGYLKKDEIMMRNGYKSAITIAFAALTSAGLKYTIDRPRPYKTYPSEITARTHSGSYSFPSGHTTSAFAMATALSLSYKEWYVAVPAYLYAGIVGYSRMRLGVHFPTDVLAGMVLGIGSGLLVWKLDRLINNK